MLNLFIPETLDFGKCLIKTLVNTLGNTTKLVQEIIICGELKKENLMSNELIWVTLPWKEHQKAQAKN